MTDPVSLVLTVLINGALGNLESAATDAISEGYAQLRQYLAQRYGRQVTESVDALERHPTSPEARQRVERELRIAGADEDPVLGDLARRLLAVVQDPFGDAGPPPPPDPVEGLRRATGLRTVGRLLEDHVGRVVDLRSRYAVEDTALLSSNIGRSNDIPRQVRDQVVGLHEQMRRIIEQIAASIEQGRYAEVEQAVGNLPAGFAERQRAQRLVEADKQAQISYDALRLTVEFFSELNQTVLANIERESSGQRQATMMFGNAVMIYELTDFVIRYISAFGLGNDIERLHADAKKRVGEARVQQRALEARVRGTDVEEAVRDQTLEDIRAREQAFDELEREWDAYLGQVRQLRLRVDEVRGKVPTLEVIRENARIQILTLQLVAMLRFLKQNSESIKGAVDTLQGFRLAPLS
jgi:hypothetical protein